MVGGYQTYPEYKDSGVEWLGGIPSHWKLKPLKYVSDLQSGIAKGKDLSGKASITVPMLRVANVQDGYLDLDDVHKIAIEPDQLLRYQLQAGDMLMNEGGDSDKLGRGAIWKAEIEPCIHQNHVFAIRPHSIEPEWLDILVQAHYVKFHFLRVSKQSTNLASISSSNIKETPVLVPPKAERQTIASFLSHETAKIDTLIDQQQQLIKLLKEKRQAVISHAVTKGLNPQAPMKDSGVEWLGEVPEHWKKVPLKHVSKISYGIGEPPKYQNKGIPLIRATNIRSGLISEKNMVLVDPGDIPENRIVWLDEGDIIVVRSGAGTGDSSIIPSAYKNTIAGFDMVVRPMNCMPEFLAYVLLSNYVRNNQIDLEKMRAAQPHLNAEELGTCFILIPPDEEQEKIILFVTRTVHRVDNLIEKAIQQVVLLQERRTTLISAAVTGKIDVRNWCDPEK